MKDNRIINYFREDIKKLDDREAYDFYRKSRNYSSTTINEYKKFKETVGRVFREITKALREDEEGVYLPNIGYFCNIHKKRLKKRNSFFLKYDVYKPMFFPDEPLKKWTMEDTENYVLSIQVNQSEVEYKPNFKLVESSHYYSVFAMSKYWNPNKNLKNNPKLNITDELN